MPNGLLPALAIWAIFLGLIYIGLFGEQWNLGKRIKNASSTQELIFLWLVRILYIVAIPIVFLLVILGAKFLWDDFKNIFKR